MLVSRRGILYYEEKTVKQKKIKAVIIEPGRIPRPIEIENDILALGRAVNIDRKGNPHPDFEPLAAIQNFTASSTL